jgi:hypothetical protein
VCWYVECIFVTVAMPTASTASTTSQLDEAPTAELVRKAFSDFQELARTEAALAGEELAAEARDAVITAVVMAASIAIGVASIAVSVAALIVANGGSVVVALGCAAALLAIAAVAGLALGLGRWPKSFLPKTRLRLARDIADVKGHLT